MKKEILEASACPAAAKDIRFTIGAVMGVLCCGLLAKLSEKENLIGLL